MFDLAKDVFEYKKQKQLKELHELEETADSYKTLFLAIIMNGLKTKNVFLSYRRFIPLFYRTLNGFRSLK